MPKTEMSRPSGAPKSKNKEAEKVIKPRKKPPVHKEKKLTLPPKEKKAAERYYEAVGRRKTAIARVRLFPAGENIFLVNGQDYRKYFPGLFMQQTAILPLSKLDAGRIDLQIHAQGGGIKAQAEACRLGLSRALAKFLPESDKLLRKLGYMTRDPRMRERKKFGLKRARRAPQWAKR